jgi:hypothetical protein
MNAACYGGGSISDKPHNGGPRRRPGTRVGPVVAQIQSLSPLVSRETLPLGGRLGRTGFG